MSIIYDALKKVEESSAKKLGDKIDKSPKSKPKIPKILIYVLVVCLGLFVANIFWGGFPKPLSNNTSVETKNQPQIPELPKETPPEANLSLPVETKVETKKELPPSFVLNGVFFSGNEGYALINNRIVKKGDIIDGATVVGIALDEVNLESEGSITKLPNNPQRP